jgi:RNA polymerase sigma factor (sigma-70 family)
MGLITSIAKRYACKEVPLEDLVHEGVFAIYKTIRSYDPSFHVLFSTYAFKKIQLQMKIVIAQQKRMIRIPMAVENKIAHIKRKINTFFMEKGCFPTAKETAVLTQESLETIEEIFYIDKSAASLFSEIGEKSRLIDIIPSLGLSTEEKISNNIITQEIERILSENLLPRQKEIIELRLRFQEEKEKPTLAFLATKFGVSGERIRQIEKRSYRKLLPVLKQCGVIV